MSDRYWCNDKIKDVAMTHLIARKLLADENGKAKGKSGAKGKKGRKGKPKDFNKDLFSSSNKDDIYPEALPGFPVAALTDAHTSDAGILCLVAIDAIRNRLRQAGLDSAQSFAAQKAAHVPIWIWNHATERATVPFGRSKGVGMSLTISQRADLWASSVHNRYLHLTRESTARMSPPIQKAAPRGVDAVGADVWTNLANAFAIQAASKGTTTTVTKKGFEAFSITTQQMILFASERDEAAAARSAPVDTYTEILGLTNAEYVAQHLHHHLKTQFGLDVLLPSGFCSAIPPFIAT